MLLGLAWFHRIKAATCTDTWYIANALVVMLATARIATMLMRHVRVGAKQGRWQDILADGALPTASTTIVMRIAVHVLLILVEADHLVEDLLSDGIDWSQLERCDSHLHIWEAPYNWLDLSVIDTVKRFYHHQVIFLLLVFHNSGLYRCEVFLVGQINVIQKRTLAWQEGTSKLKRLCMPEFRFTLLCRCVKRLVFLHLDNESNFGRVTEVGHCKATDFLDERFSS